MKKLYTKINELWLRYKQWIKSSFLGDITASILNICLAFVLFIIFFHAIGLFGPVKDKAPSDSAVADSTDTTSENCTVTGINLHGTLVTYIPLHADNDNSFNYDSVSSENIMGAIKEANTNPKIKAIVIEVDSAGGSPTAGEEVANALKNSEKPVVALVREVGASASYWAISSASKIFASKNSNIGSIGVTSSYLSNVGKNNKDGYTFEQLSVGKFKDSGNYDKPLTQEEKDLFMRDNLIVYQNFIETVANNRNIPIEKVKAIADGSTVLGTKALELGLIDQIGGLPEVEKYLEETTGEVPEICWQ